MILLVPFISLNIAFRYLNDCEWSNNPQPTNPRFDPRPSWSRPPTRTSDYDSPSRPRSHTPSPPRRGFDRDRDRDWGDKDRSFGPRDRSGFDAGLRVDNGKAFTPDPLPPRRHFMPASLPPRDRTLDRDVWNRGKRKWNERRDDRFQDDIRLDR